MRNGFKLDFQIDNDEGFNGKQNTAAEIAAQFRGMKVGGVRSAIIPDMPTARGAMASMRHAAKRLGWPTNSIKCVIVRNGDTLKLKAKRTS